MPERDVHVYVRGALGNDSFSRVVEDSTLVHSVELDRVRKIKIKMCYLGQSM